VDRGLRFTAVVVGSALVLGWLTLPAVTVGANSSKHKGHESVDTDPGIGAKLSAWKAAYSRHSGCSGCFGPGGRNSTGKFISEFYNVQATDGIVTNYTENFPANTDLTSAEAMIERMLPGDPGTIEVGTPAVVHNGGTCVRWNVTLPKLGSPSSLGSPKIGDTSGTVGIELNSPLPDTSTTPTYTTRDIALASVSITASGPTVAC
jgi:hypothetical protein